VFTEQERSAVRDRLVARAQGDPDIVAAAFTGSHTTGAEDAWSDVDLVLGLRATSATDVADGWTTWLYGELGALHHWDLPTGDQRIVRVTLLPNWLELDVTFAPGGTFGARGPEWQLIFGEDRHLAHFPKPDANTIAGLGWHHLLHAYVAIERARWWQAEHWISATRNQILTSAALRLGLPSSYARGAHLLPDEVTTQLPDTLVRNLSESELRRALAATGTAYLAELHAADAALADRLEPALRRLTD
jgi:hypothetical protein